MRPFRRREAPVRRWLGLALVAALVGALLAIVPPPALAYERGARADLHVPALVRRSAHTVARGLHMSPFDMIGVSFHGPATAPVELRVRTARGWTEWEPVAVEPAEGPDPGTEERTSAQLGPSAHVTEPVWVGGATAYEVSLPGGVTDVRTHLVRETTTRVRLTLAEARAEAAPTIRARSSWGARQPKVTPTIANRLRLAVVHHTGEAGQRYSAAQVPRMIRAIQAFHMDVRGWNDIAYNFVVDRFGRIWEGRAGGIAKAVVGGHARGFNTRSTGVVVLGNFDHDRVPGDALTALRRLLGWKLFVHGVDPRAIVRFTSLDSPRWPGGTTQWLNAIVGHARVGATACPGNRLEAKLGAIRSGAGARYDALRGAGTFATRDIAYLGAARPLPGDFNGDSRSDVLWYGPGDEPDVLWLGRADGNFSVRQLTIARTFEPIVGDFDHDGRGDVFWYGPGDAVDRVWFGRSDGTFWATGVSVPGNHVPVAGDFDGDLRTDVLWYGPGRGADRLWLGEPGRTFRSVPLRIPGFHTFQTVGDFNDDDRADVLWYTPGSDPDALWLGRADGSFRVRDLAYSFDSRPFVGDFGGGEGSDLLWYGAGNQVDGLWISDTAARFSTRALSIGGSLRPVVADVDGGGRDDVFWHGPALEQDGLWINDGSGGFRRSTWFSLLDATPYAFDGDGDGLDDVLLTRPGPATEQYLRAT